MTTGDPRPFDIIVLGSGPAGRTIATLSARAGRRVAIVENRTVGGTCALRGCNPKKVVANAAALVDAARRSDGQLVSLEGIDIDWSTLRSFVREFTDPVEENARESLEEAGVTVLEGSPAFRAPRTLLVNDESITADDVVICVGARPRPLDVPGAEHVTTSDEFFELDELPRRIACIGGGYVGFELVHFAARAGRETIIFENGERPLGMFDPDLVEDLVRRGRQIGVAVRAETSIAEVREEASGALRLTADGGEEFGPFDLVLHGAGRVPSTAELDLERAGIATHEGAIEVDGYLRSVSAQGIWAAGDCAHTLAPSLTPAANAAAKVVLHNLLEDDLQSYAPGPVPSVLFTTPPLAAVGESPGPKHEVLDLDLSSHGAVRKVGESAARAKIVLSGRDRRIVGAHLLGPAADELVNLFALAIATGRTVEQFKDVVFAFPTFGADLQSAL